MLGFGPTYLKIGKVPIKVYFKILQNITHGILKCLYFI